MGRSIEFVREYEFYGSVLYDVLYSSNRLVCYEQNALPRTVKQFLALPEIKRTEQYDRVFKREEVIYRV